MIDLASVMKRANYIYRDVRGYDMASEQIKALAEALVEAINDALDGKADKSNAEYE